MHLATAVSNKINDNPMSLISKDRELSTRLITQPPFMMSQNESHPSRYSKAYYYIRLLITRLKTLMPLQVQYEAIQIDLIISRDILLIDSSLVSMHLLSIPKTDPRVLPPM